MPPRPLRKHQQKIRQKLKKDLRGQRAYEAALKHLQLNEYDEGLAKLQEAASLLPGNVDIIEAYGSLLAEMGDVEKAIPVLKKAVGMQPDKGHEKYLYLGQCLEGHEALEYVTKGVGILQSMVDQESTSSSTDITDARHTLCCATCSLVEQHLALPTDNFPALAEKCFVHLENAKLNDPSSPEPLQLQSSILNELGKQDESYEKLGESMAKWYGPLSSDTMAQQETTKESPREAFSWDNPPEKPVGSDAQMADENEGREMEVADEDMGEGDDEELPTYEFRLACVRLLLEVAPHVKDALNILNRLMLENDSLPETWYLHSLALYSCGDMESAEASWIQGHTLLTKQQFPEEAGAWGHFVELKERIEEASGKKIAMSKKDSD